jgi:hypothetical protein
MTRRLIGLGVIALIVIIALVTNPSRDTHLEEIRDEQTVVGSALTIAADQLGAFEYHNYLIFSTVTLDEDTVSVGLFGQVWVDEAESEEDVEI